MAVLLSLSSTLFAQQTGTVTGQVSDSTTGKYLEGAEVSISGTDRRTTTERNGTFTLRMVPVGTQTVVVNYPGLDTKEESVQVTAGQATNVAVSMVSSEIITLGEFRVEGAKEGMSQAIALQKVAVQGKLVAAGDQFGSIAEGNIGEYLKYLPGVGVDYNSNDARGISLRGLKTQFTIVSIDGTPMASAASGGANRRFETEQVASNNVETTEVYKTVSPDIPADATGGYINMVTKSAFDRQDVSRFNYDVSFIVPHTRLGDAFSKQDGVWGNGEEFVVRPNLDVNYARRVSDKFGFNVSYRFSERYDDSPRTEFTWRAVNRTGDTGQTVSLEDPTLQTYLQNNEQKLTHRESFATKIDYFITDATKLTFAGQWNWYDLTFHQRGTQFNLGTSGVNNVAGIETNNSGTGSNIRNAILQRNKYGTTVHGNAVLSHEFSSNLKAWVTGYWSQASSKYRDNTKGFMANATASYNPGAYSISGIANNPELPAIGGASRSAILDLSNYSIITGGGTIRPNTAQDTKHGVRADVKYAFDTAMPLSIQVGTAYDETGRNIITQQFNLPAGALSAANNNAELYKSDFLFDYDYGFGAGEVLDVYKMYNTFGDVTHATRPATWNVNRFDETNLAGYVRVDFNPLNDLLITGGFRYEEHELEANGYSVVTAGSTAFPYEVKYDKIYPSVSARYTPNRNWVVRAGFSQTVGHPDYSDVLPAVNIPDDIASGANLSFPSDDLEPYYVNNYDASVEYYFSKSGLIGLAVFHKDLEGYIVPETLNVSDPAVEAALRARFGPWGLDDAQAIRQASTRVNGVDASLQGVELQYNQTLSFLPKPFNGLNLQANWTKIYVDGDDLTTRYGMEQNAVTDAFNFVVGYRIAKFSANVSTNYTGDTLVTVGTPVNTWKAPDWKTNVSVRYEISRHYIVYADVSNIFSKREEYWKGRADTNESVELPGRFMEYGYPHISIGVRGTF